MIDAFVTAIKDKPIGDLDPRIDDWRNNGFGTSKILTATYSYSEEWSRVVFLFLDQSGEEEEEKTSVLRRGAWVEYKPKDDDIADIAFYSFQENVRVSQVLLCVFHPRLGDTPQEWYQDHGSNVQG